ncbi:PLP-dependent aminotransferase family protein [Micromonospora eburnea]|uniref:DNA-binding transcriptional regulator, MocR family, contains an aminotransferase domain n=1 Tax=Micromonospora eburnea TaxID=227316 RepID=A0A1C6UT20_9ACTN|nr:PLP-dependent aminotransferase family protein [Micromonospora eburnea]SCL57130.1 DNA-binding transcriptional regulator, MocR family, contains an aminotransferase domain [Micromonospora eburnea]
MNDDNALVRVIQDLRTRAAGAAPGTRLPSIRELTGRHRASPVTVTRAIRQLVADGLVEARPGRGTFVAAHPDRHPLPDLSWQAVALGPRPDGEEAMQALLAVARPGTIPLSSGYLDAELHPVAAIGAALARAARQPAAWQRGPVEGREDLRAWFAREAGGGLRADDMVICPGGQAALSTAFRALTAPGDTVLVESPTYLGALAAARAAGLRVVPVPADVDGVRPELLAAAFTRTGARLFYCQPLYANPHGAVLATARRTQVADAVRAAGAFLLEDDYARDLTIEGEPPPPLAADDPDGHVIYLRSLTKSVAPGLRVAAIGARGPAGARLRSARVLDDFFVAGPMQQAALDLVTSPAWDRHLRTLRKALRARRDALLAALRRHLPAVTPVCVPRGGLHVWVGLPEGLDDTELAVAAAAERVVVFPGRPWHAAEPLAPYLRLTFAAAPPDVLDEGVRRLARAVSALD